MLLYCLTKMPRLLMKGGQAFQGTQGIAVTAFQGSCELIRIAVTASLLYQQHVVTGNYSLQMFFNFLYLQLHDAMVFECKTTTSRKVTGEIHQS